MSEPIRILLTNGEFALVRDDKFGRKLSGIRWRYASYGYAMTRLGGKDIYMHHLVYANYHPEYVSTKGIDIDHKDGNSLNNQPENLRLLTHGENVANCRMHKNNKSGYRGVSWSRHANKWRVTIRYRNKQYELGYFKDILKAVDAHKEAFKKYYPNLEILKEKTSGD